MKPPLAKALAMGIIAGMRAFSAPAALCYAMKGKKDPNSKLVHFFCSSRTAIAFTALAAGEMCGDKIPGIPNRTDAPGLAGRAVAGGIAGATLYTAAGQKAFTGALIGGAAAIAATFASFYLRKAIGENCRVPDAACGLAEDALVVTTAALTAK
ncbi:DUF4126 family protein [Deminuibacter soli]|uniref:DUF4126 family protein n=1 Tax=Deminuibacter soli TaxID=2291815 RepID=A0A3E1NED4_9BACT|nr:DUF4126 family protein [Deminuibacter soli]RFM26345.1 DUF4126 family protein [Deminuibacter soli]